MKKLDLPDSEDSIIRKQLLKLDDKALEELSMKSEKEIFNSLFQENEKETTQLKIEEAKKQNQRINSKDKQTLKNEQDIQKIKSVFTPQILEQNPNIADKLNSLD